MNINSKKLIVVLGMHRSGTSALTRGLQELNVALGERLLPGVEANNEKGFWEDIDFVSFNNELLHFLGYNWHSMAPVSPLELESENLIPFKVRAIALLGEKLEGLATFGIKDPRTARLLPFWRDIFEHLNLEVSYVIALRHPLSVANSLFKRDNFELEKSMYLWLGHMVPSILESENNPRVVVDYDALMARPKEQLLRIANALNLSFSNDDISISEYCNDFLADDLRHTQFHLSDLKSTSHIPQDVVDAYELLTKLANDESPTKSPSIHKAFVALDQRMTEMRPAFMCMSKNENRIASLSQAVNERDTQIASLTQQIQEQQQQANTLTQLLQEEQNQTTALTQLLQEAQQQIASLTQQIQEAQHQTAATTQQLQEAQYQICSLTQQTQEKQHQIDALLSSASWKFTAPLRGAAKIIRQEK